MATATTTATTQTLRGELEALKLTALIRRARDAGVDEMELENAQDGDTPKPSIIELIVAKQAPSSDGSAALRVPELRVLVVRHGARPFEGHDPELDPKGHDQAEALASCLLARYPKVRAIYSSPFIRALQTSAPIARVYAQRVRVEYGVCELLAKGWLQKEDPLPHLAFAKLGSGFHCATLPEIADDYCSSPPPTFPDCRGVPKSEEKRSACLQRHRAVLDAIETEHVDGGVVIVVAHGASHDFMAVACGVDLPVEQRVPYCVANCSVTTLVRCEKNQWRMEGFGEELIPEALRQHM